MVTKAASAAAVEAAQSLRVVIGRLRRQMQGASAIGQLTAAQASALARLAMNEPSSTSVLAGAERVRPQSMAATVSDLEKRGLIRRENDPDDGRRQLLYLTAQGRKYARGARASREEWLARTLAQRLTDAELAVVKEAMVLLERIVDP